MVLCSRSHVLQYVLASPFTFLFCCDCVVFFHPVAFFCSYMVIASDGLWDVMQNDEIPHVLSGFGRASDGSLDTAAMARHLAKQACRRMSMDNITVLVVDFAVKAHFSTASEEE